MIIVPFVVKIQIFISLFHTMPFKIYFFQILQIFTVRHHSGGLS